MIAALGKNLEFGGPQDGNWQSNFLSERGSPTGIRTMAPCYLGDVLAIENCACRPGRRSAPHLKKPSKAIAPRHHRLQTWLFTPRWQPAGAAAMGGDLRERTNLKAVVLIMVSRPAAGAVFRVAR